MKGIFNRIKDDKEMSMNVNQDYSQFYARTGQLKSYGSNPAAKKDTLVKYCFNTTDEQGGDGRGSSGKGRKGCSILGRECDTA